jgi:hypothetical protein
VYHVDHYVHCPNVGVAIYEQQQQQQKQEEVGIKK